MFLLNVTRHTLSGDARMCGRTVGAFVLFVGAAGARHVDLTIDSLTDPKILA